MRLQFDQEFKQGYFDSNRWGSKIELQTSLSLMYKTVNFIGQKHKRWFDNTKINGKKYRFFILQKLQTLFLVAECFVGYEYVKFYCHSLQRVFKYHIVINNLNKEKKGT